MTDLFISSIETVYLADSLYKQLPCCNRSRCGRSHWRLTMEKLFIVTAIGVGIDTVEIQVHETEVS